MSPYVPRRCPICGSALDPGEQCDCTEAAYDDYLGDQSEEAGDG